MELVTLLEEYGSKISMDAISQRSLTIRGGIIDDRRSKARVN
jgi:hypothetical protein